MLQDFHRRTTPETGAARLRALRAAMAEAGIDAFLVPRADAHQGENVAPRDERLAWLTGFTGSAGLAVAGAERAAIFVDGRYRLQVRDQVDAASFALLRHPEDRPADWLIEALPQGGRLGFDPWLHTAAEIETFSEALGPRQIGLVRVPNLVDAVWSDQPPPPARPILPHPEALAGRSAAGLFESCTGVAQADVAAALQNSLIIALATMTLCLVFGALAAYPLSRLQLPRKNWFLTISIVSRMIPSMVLIIPMFLIMRQLRLLDTYLSLIIVYTTFLLPYVIWMLKNFFDQIPYALEAAARMDGCTRLGALFRVMIPVAGPGVVATAVFAFIGAWNEYLFALTFTSVEPDARTLPVIIANFPAQFSQQVPFGEIMAAGIVASIPLIVLVFIFQRRIVAGLTAGAVKG